MSLANLAIVVVFPVPFIPRNIITYGLLDFSISSKRSKFENDSSSMSVSLSTFSTTVSGSAPNFILIPRSFSLTLDLISSATS